MKVFTIKIILTLLVVIALLLPFFHPSPNSGLLEELKILGIHGVLVVLGFFFVFVYFYCKDLQKILESITPKNRVATPKSVWLMFLIPYNFVEDFFIVYNVSRSLKNEATFNPALNKLKYFGMYSGIGWCLSQVFSLAPGYIGKVSSVFAIILWVIHWRFIRHTTNLLKTAKTVSK